MSLLTEVFCRTDSDTTGLTNLTKETERLGMRLRLSGRDFMRLGGFADKGLSGITSQMSNFLNKSMSWSIFLEDINFAFEDIADTVADLLVPPLEFVTDYLEGFAEFLEENVWAAWLLAGLVALVGIGAALGKIISTAFIVQGVFNLFAGAVLTSRKHSLSLTQTLRFLSAGLKGGGDAASEYLLKINKIAQQTKVTEESIKEEITALQQKKKEIRNQKKDLERERSKAFDPKTAHKYSTKDVDAMSKEISRLNVQELKTNSSLKQRKRDLKAYQKETMEAKKKLSGFTDASAASGSATEDSAESQGLFGRIGKKSSGLVSKLTGKLAFWKKNTLQGADATASATKEQKNFNKGTGKTGSSISKTGAIIGSISGIFAVLLMTLEPVQDLFEALSEAFQTALEPLEPAFDILIDWIENNPELSAGISVLVMGLVSLASILLQMVVLLPGIAGGAAGTTAGFGSLAASVSGLATSLGPIGAIIGVVVIVCYEIYRVVTLFTGALDRFNEIAGEASDPLESLKRIFLALTESILISMFEMNPFVMLLKLLGIETGQTEEGIRNFINAIVTGTFETGNLGGIFDWVIILLKDITSETGFFRTSLNTLVKVADWVISNFFTIDAIFTNLNNLLPLMIVFIDVLADSFKWLIKPIKDVYEALKPILDFSTRVGGLLPSFNISQPATGVPLFQEGGLITKTGLAIVHKDETVLPPNLTTKLPLPKETEVVSKPIFNILNNEEVTLPHNVIDKLLASKENLVNITPTLTVIREQETVAPVNLVSNIESLKSTVIEKEVIVPYKYMPILEPIETVTRETEVVAPVTYVSNVEPFKTLVYEKEVVIPYKYTPTFTSVETVVTEQEVVAPINFIPNLDSLKTIVYEQETIVPYKYMPVIEPIEVTVHEAPVFSPTVTSGVESPINLTLHFNGVIDERTAKQVTAMIQKELVRLRGRM